MSAPLKLAGFATLLVLIFGVAVAAGDVIGPDRDDSVVPEGGMGEHGEGAVDPIRGLSISEGGLSLELQQTSPELVFSITEDGEPVRDFEVEHEQPHAPDRRAPRRHRLPAPAPRAGRGRRVARAADR